MNDYKKIVMSHWFWHLVALVVIFTLGAVCFGGNIRYSKSIRQLEFRLDKANRELGVAVIEFNRRENERQEFYSQFEQGLRSIKANLISVSTGLPDYTARLRKVSESVKQMEESLDSVRRNDSN